MVFAAVLAPWRRPPRLLGLPNSPGPGIRSAFSCPSTFRTRSTPSVGRWFWTSWIGGVSTVMFGRSSGIILIIAILINSYEGPVVRNIYARVPQGSVLGTLSVERRVRWTPHRVGYGRGGACDSVRRRPRPFVFG